MAGMSGIRDGDGELGAGPRPGAEHEAAGDAGDIGVVVVTHRSARTAEDCLSRLRAARGVAAIRVVDNGSDDDTMLVVQRHASADPRLRFVANPDNPGFAVACNQGVASLDGTLRWLALVNPDCLVGRDDLARMRAHAAAAGGEMLLGADLVDEAGVRDAAARRRDPDFAAMLRDPVRASRLGIAPDDTLALQPVDAVSGALLLLTRALFDRIGGFDEAYRLHAEDLDLCRRARDAGARIAVANDVRVLHLRGVSSHSRPVFVEWHKHRGLWRWFRKFEAPRRGPLVRAVVFMMVWARFPLALVRALLRRIRPVHGSS
jgi:N-acetylglucosaminyl-diphospho-decaprenol L-rhamnosyltransferase